ncbi:hypothetical protein PPYR_07147 [Photinus pyralis]|uniref:Uncharacterized protein n=1 Tax=Photinus pyralis TaxID=7054 RepID=A0A5N4APL7_PHOPY|nr:uncharacterized protein LOC116169020 [Photinus pyralis]KAB0799267.1 hypothetical protein PPYR_07147 [Photinus pyralis]
MNTTTGETEIQQVYRIGAKQLNKVRPVFIKLAQYETKIEVLKKAKNLKGTNIYIHEDFPKHVLEERKVLATHLRTARESGHRAYLKYNKLIVNGEEYGVEDITSADEQDDEVNEVRKKPRTRTISQRSPQPTYSKKASSMDCLPKN